MKMVYFALGTNILDICIICLFLVVIFSEWEKLFFFFCKKISQSKDYIEKKNIEIFSSFDLIHRKLPSEEKPIKHLKVTLVFCKKCSFYENPESNF